MVLKTLFWILTFLGIIPVILFLFAFFWMLSISDTPVRTLLDSRSWNYHANVYQSGNRFSDPIKKEEIKLYPRLWTLLVGACGAVALVIFAVYTLHIPYK